MNKELTFEVVDDEKIRLDVFLADNTEFSRSAIKNFVDKGKVLLCQKTSRSQDFCKCKAGQILKTGDKICVDVEVVDSEIKPVDIPLDIVYQDDDIVVVNKQQGLTVHAGNKTGDYTLVNALLFHIKNLSGINCELRPGIVHRIDKNTTGLLVVAKNDKAHAELSQQISQKICRRIYVAICEGTFKDQEGDIIAPIGRSKKDRTKMDVCMDGRFAKTHYKVLEQFSKFGYVQFELSTGRTHQIRVHAKHIHHPIVGDDVYNPKSKYNSLSPNGQLLHSQKLILIHPTTGQQMEFSAPIPQFFEEVLQNERQKIQNQ